MIKKVIKPKRNSIVHYLKSVIVGFSCISVIFNSVIPCPVPLSNVSQIVINNIDHCVLEFIPADFQTRGWITVTWYEAVIDQHVIITTLIVIDENLITFLKSSFD